MMFTYSKIGYVLTLFFVLATVNQHVSAEVTLSKGQEINVLIPSIPLVFDKIELGNDYNKTANETITFNMTIGMQVIKIEAQNLPSGNMGFIFTGVDNTTTSCASMSRLEIWENKLNLTCIEDQKTVTSGVLYNNFGWKDQNGTMSLDFKMSEDAPRGFKMISSTGELYKSTASSSVFFGAWLIVSFFILVAVGFY